jgi:hypothetical protein
LERYGAANDLKERIATLALEFPESARAFLAHGGELCVGQTVRHKEYGYRGVILKCDATCKAGTRLMRIISLWWLTQIIITLRSINNNNK